MLKGAGLLQKLKLYYIEPTTPGMELFKQAAARLVSSFSLIPKSYTTFEGGIREASKRLSYVKECMRSEIQGQSDDEQGILLNNEQAESCHGEVASTFIIGSFGSGKTEITFQIIRNFCKNKIENYSCNGLVIVGLFSDRGYCNKIMEDYHKMITDFLKIPHLGNEAYYGLSAIVGVKDWLLERFAITQEATLVLIINTLMKRISQVHKDTDILLVLDEVSQPFEDDGVNWRRLEIPDRMKLVLNLKPTVKYSKSYCCIPPLRETMKLIVLKRQYRSSKIINEFIKDLSNIFGNLGQYTTLMPGLLRSIDGHEIPGAVTQWYRLSADSRSKF